MRRTKREVVTEFRCTEILDAGRRLFSTRGFREVTIDEIAAEAGLAKATVYQYFRSKQDIYLGALRAGVREMLDLTQAQIAAASGTRAKIEAFIRTRLQYMEQNREFFGVYHHEFGNLIHPASLNQEFRKLYRRQFELLSSVLQEGVQHGELEEVSADVLATTIQESTRGLMLHRSLGWSKGPVENQVQDLMAIVWVGAGRKEGCSK